MIIYIFLLLLVSNIANAERTKIDSPLFDTLRYDTLKRQLYKPSGFYLPGRNLFNKYERRVLPDYNVTNHLLKYKTPTVYIASIVYDDGTNVGIGTGAPAYRLDVHGGARIKGSVVSSGNAMEVWNSQEPLVSFSNSGSVDFVKTGLRFWSSSIVGVTDNPTISKMNDSKYLSLAGAILIAPNTNNVLINTSNDAGYPLNVNGSVRMGVASGNNNRFMIFNAGTANDDALLISTPTLTAGPGTGFRYAPKNTNSGRQRGFVVSFPVITSSNSHNVGFEIDDTVSATATITGVNSRVARVNATAARTAYSGYFSAINDNGKAYAVYSAAGLNYFSGNTGIGTADPTASMHINGTVRMESLGRNDTLSRIMVTDINGNIGYRSAATLMAGTINGSANYVPRFTAANAIGNSSIYDDGNGVGVGTIHPTASMHINGTVRMESLGRDDTLSRIVVTDMNGNVSYRNAGSITAGMINGSANYVSRFTGAGSVGNSSIYDDGSGVGIGTVSPTASMHINGSVRMEALNRNDTLSRVVVTDINGNISYRSANTLMAGTINGSANYVPRFTAVNAIGNSSIYDDGNAVGIGTTSPGVYRLAVEGTVGARKVKVSQDTWPDYVFEKNYPLLTLSELERYIQQHRHLPDIPSADDVKQNGLDLGDNQAALLKKIEELTLYVIDLEKRLQEQEKTAKRKKRK